ncbi:DUF4232 domain-containing protein [Leifsonia poae]|uniref:DUF4232 domain-containing protein n=1 Tax=Leifsonia poae TaxID=110933 RepID=UPI001CBEA88C|nr:DUF4232 domain-containing protein [Leifsonia poae]
MATSHTVRMSLLIAAVAVVLTGCATTSGTPSGSPSSSSSPTETTSPRPTGSSSPIPIDGQCATADLTGTIGKGGGGAAGSVEVTIVLTNNGSAQCSLQGWPGVSFVGDGNGTQLGKAAEFDRSTPHATVTLSPGGSVQAPLRITQALNYSTDDCKPQQADGFRVYPPGSTESLFVKDADVTACTSTSISLLTVGALAAS